jgi:hypothetical protein
MNTDTQPIYLPQRFQLRGAAPNVGRLLWHFIQMILVMEAGMMIYHHLVWPILAPTGYAAFTRDYPLFGYWMMVLSMALPMIAFMRAYHGATWDYCIGMALAMLTPLAVLTMLVFFSLIPIHALYTVGDPLMFLAMALYMLYWRHDPAYAKHTPKVLPRVIHIPVRVEKDEDANAWHAETQIKIRFVCENNSTGG